MKSDLAYSRDILAMDDKGLETFVHRWVAGQLKQYVDSHLFGNANDLGRDAVGFRTADRHEGAWDNYQCKMLGRRLDEATMHIEIAKILFHASEGQFTPPEKYFFVAPKGFSRGAERLLYGPMTFKEEMLASWDEKCAKRIRKGPPIPLTDKLRATIEAYKFENIAGFDTPKILALDGIRLVLADVFGDDPGEAPPGKVPAQVSAAEGYVEQLVGVYSEADGVTYADANEIMRRSSHSTDLTMQRRRYFEADAFRRHFRDSIDPKHVDSFTEEIHHGVFDLHAVDFRREVTRVFH